MWKNGLRAEAQHFRASGSTYQEIQLRLPAAVPKATIYSWCRDIATPVWYEEKMRQLNKLHNARARAAAVESKRRDRTQTIERMRSAVRSLIGSDPINTRLLMIALAMLYLGEGGKRAGSAMALGSSDPKIMQLYIILLSRCYGISPGDLKARICFRADQDLAELQRFWSSVTHIPIENFYRSKPDPRTIGHPTLKTNYRGVCALYGGSARMKIELAILAEELLSLLQQQGGVGPVA